MQILKTKLNSFHQNVQRIQKTDDLDAVFMQWLKRCINISVLLHPQNVISNSSINVIFAISMWNVTKF